MLLIKGEVKSFYVSSIKYIKYVPTPKNLEIRHSVGLIVIVTSNIIFVLRKICLVLPVELSPDVIKNAHAYQMPLLVEDQTGVNVSTAVEVFAEQPATIALGV